ncbi:MULTISPECIES: hypothetical protein [Streptomyces]|uniref:Uncharacterized protein n=1 Tax=Streptomyces griseus TaxID=1911 RepID=A0A380ML63_STRGR|nr:MULTISPECIES: hypothetical protein [Streptomyces]MDQ0294299.1 putative Zn finger protein [Streptomyces sp. DSM 41037]WPR52246.1 hypothetical protein SJI45_15600 [Streptomyces sp. S399]GFH64456.1 hypothetical protein Srut_09700 [Streptomyces rutgersensis]SUO92988.1 Uncharacterised protein [Streptomyces griseus]
MNGIDQHAVDDAIVHAFKEVRSAMDTHSEKSLRMYGEALTALQELRKALAADQPPAR